MVFIFNMVYKFMYIKDIEEEEFMIKYVVFVLDFCFKKLCGIFILLFQVSFVRIMGFFMYYLFLYFIKQDIKNI